MIFIKYKLTNRFSKLANLEKFILKMFSLGLKENVNHFSRSLTVLKRRGDKVHSQANIIETGM